MQIDVNTSYLSFESVDGVDIAVADYRGCTPEEFICRLRVVSDWVTQQPHRSVVIATLVAGIGYNSGAMRSLVSLLRETKPHILGSAVVGLSHLTLLIRVINHLANRDLQTFETLDEAKLWLAGRATHDRARVVAQASRR